MEALETTCYENMLNIKKNTIGLGVEFDENSVCNVCQSVSTAIDIIVRHVCGTCL